MKPSTQPRQNQWVDWGNSCCIAPRLKQRFASNCKVARLVKDYLPLGILESTGSKRPGRVIRFSSTRHSLVPEFIGYVTEEVQRFDMAVVLFGFA